MVQYHIILYTIVLYNINDLHLILYNITITNCYYILLIIIRCLNKMSYKYKLEMLRLILINKIYNKLYHTKCIVIVDAAQ